MVLSDSGQLITYWKAYRSWYWIFNTSSHHWFWPPSDFLQHKLTSPPIPFYPASQLTVKPSGKLVWRGEGGIYLPKWRVEWEKGGNLPNLTTSSSARKRDCMKTRGNTHVNFFLNYFCSKKSVTIKEHLRNNYCYKSKLLVKTKHFWFFFSF